MKVYAGAGTGGSLLHTQTVANASVVAAGGYTDYTVVTLSSTVNITSGNVYTFTLTDGADWIYNTVGDYAGGQLYFNGSAVAGYDMIFQVVQGDPPNAAPTITGTSAGYTSNDTGTVSPFPAVTINDGDSATVTTTVTLDTNAKGVFTPASLASSGFTGTGPYTLAATAPATAQSKIRLLDFDPADNRVAPTNTETTTFTISVDDGTAAAVTDNTTTVVSTSVNDAPTLTSFSSVIDTTDADRHG